MKRVDAGIISNERVLEELERREGRSTAGSWIIWLRCPEIAREAKPGQFVMVTCGTGENLLPRPFSIHRVDEEGNMALFFAVWADGKGTRWLSRRREGETVTVLGPLGNGFSARSGAKNLLLVAGGVGLAPLHFLAERALNSGYSVKMLYGTSGAVKPSGEPNPDQLYPENLLPPRLKDAQSITTSPDGLTGMVLDLLTLETVGWADQVFACGPMPMYVDMYRRRLELLKGKPVQVSLEVRMGCGLGICYGCTIKTRGGLRKVCQDGPVFDLDDVIWDEVKC